MVGGYRKNNPTNGERDSGLMQRRSNNQPLYKPEFWEKVQYLDENGNKEDSNFHCMPAGVPRMGPPNKIVQTPTEVIFMYNAKNAYRIIPTDGRPHDKVNSEDQTFLGDSIGAWEGDTLVVDVVGFNDTSWLGWPGYFHTNRMRVIERLRRDGNTLHYQATVEDPDVLMEPWVMNPRTLQLDTTAAAADRGPALHRVGRREPRHPRARLTLASDSLFWVRTAPHRAGAVGTPPSRFVFRFGVQFSVLGSGFTVRRVAWWSAERRTRTENPEP